jgi:hypothetical protein
MFSFVSAIGLHASLMLVLIWIKPRHYRIQTAMVFASRAAPMRTTCRGGMLSLEVPCIAIGRRPDETICCDHVERDSGRFGR